MRLTLHEERRGLTILIENDAPARIAVLHPESPAPVRAFLRVKGDVLHLAKIAAEPPTGMHVHAVPSPFVAVLEAGAVLQEHHPFAEVSEYDPMHAVTFYRDNPEGSGRVRLSARRLVHAVELVVEYVHLSAARELRRVGPEQLLHPGLARAEIATASESIALTDPLEVIAYSWERA